MGSPKTQEANLIRHGLSKYFIFWLSKKDNKVAYVDLPWEHLGIFSDYYSLVQLVTFCFNRLPKDELKPSWQFLRKDYMMHIFIIYLSRRISPLEQQGKSRSLSTTWCISLFFISRVDMTYKRRWSALGLAGRWSWSGLRRGGQTNMLTVPRHQSLAAVDVYLSASIPCDIEPFKKYTVYIFASSTCPCHADKLHFFGQVH